MKIIHFIIIFLAALIIFTFLQIGAEQLGQDQAKMFYGADE